MDCQQAVISMSKYVAQAKDLIQKYIDENIELDGLSPLNDALVLLNNALDNVIT